MRGAGRTARAPRSAAAAEIDGLDAVAALRHGRRVARLSQRDLARRAAVSQSLIARIEARRVDPPVGVIQRLLGLCGMRWDLRLVAGGATPAAAGARGKAVREASRRREAAARARRRREHAAARQLGRRLDSCPPITVRERRARMRAVRLDERAAAAEACAAVMIAGDEQAHAWVARDAADGRLQFARCADLLAQPLAERLPWQVPDGFGDDLWRVLDQLSRWYANPPVALTGAIARSVWSPGRPSPRHPGLTLAALGGRDDAVEFFHRVGARPAGAERFVLGELPIRLGRGEPPPATLVRWRSGPPFSAIVVARPENRRAAGVDRHAIRALLEHAGRDRVGRRRPPYRETWDGAPGWWIDTTSAGVGRAT